ncbi:MAG: hypothetical protein KDK70_31230 [Myxococcales bacterium]|nr:hypothetical protein [Myxococcales bacterium]
MSVLLVGMLGCRPALVTVETVDVPAGAPPTGVHAEAGMEPGRWDEWTDARLVLALHESPYFPTTEDQTHARLMAFEDGRMLYRVREGELWQWYVVQLDQDQIETLRRAVARDLAGARSITCSYATHQTRTALVVRTGARWRVRHAYGLWACLPEVGWDPVPAYSQPDVPPPAVSPDHGLLRAHRRLDELREQHHASAREWYTPRVSLEWAPYSPSEGEYTGAPWPDSLPSPPALGEHHAREDVHLRQPVDGSFDLALRLELPLRGLVEIDGASWIVQVHREQPGDPTVGCAATQPWRRCR